MITADYFCRKMFVRMFCASSISGLALALSNIIDAVCVGGVIGETGLAAIGIISPLYIFYNVLGYGFSVGGSVAFTKLISDGEEKRAVDHFNEMMELLMLISVLFVTSGSLLLTPLLHLLGAGDPDSVLFGYCYDYARILIWSFPVFMMNFMFNDFLRCDDNPYLATASFVTGSLLDFGLNILLVLVLGWGIEGSAIATFVGQTVSVIIAVPHFFLKNKTLKFRLVVPNLRRCLLSFRTGVSTSIESLFMFAFLLTSNHLLIHSSAVDGELYVAVFDVIMNISYITGSMFLAAGETLRPLASTFYAEHNRNLARYALRLSLTWSFILNGVIIGAIAVFADKFSMLFGIHTAAGLEVSIYAVRIFCIGTMISGFSIIFSAYCQAMARPRAAMCITVFRTCLFLMPITILLGLFNTVNFWYAIPAAEALTVLCILLFMTRRIQSDVNENYFSYMLCKAENIGEVLEKTEAFCDEHEISIRQTNMVIMFIEETCSAIIQNAFNGKQDEYIQVTVAVENDGEFVLHVRDSAITFNPFDMKTKKISDENDDDHYFDSVGILMMKNKAKDFYYRRYQGFNMLTIKF